MYASAVDYRLYLWFVAPWSIRDGRTLCQEDRIGREVQTKEHTRTRWGETPGLKQKNPRAISPRTQEPSLLRWWPAMRAHPTWQRPLGVTSLSFFTPFSLLARSPRLLHALTSDLLDLIIIEISSDNYQYKSRRRARRRRRDPHVHAGEDAFLAAGSTRDHREPPDPPRAIR